MLIGAPSATAATQIGQTFAPDEQCGIATALQSFSPGNEYTVPAAGVITEWRFQAASPAPELKFKVARRVTGNEYTIVGESALQTMTANTVNSFPARIAVQAGDVIGFYHATQTAPCAIAPAAPGYFVSGFNQGDATPGQTHEFAPPISAQLPIAATLEPDCDSDGFGDETQDAVVDCVLPETHLTKVPKDKIKTKKKRKKVTFEFNGTDARAIASFQCSLDGAPLAPCTSPYTVKVKKGTHTFEVQAIDQAGNVGAPATDAFKVKRKKKK